MRTKLAIGLGAALAGLFCATGAARAWEVIGGSSALPTFAANGDSALAIKAASGGNAAAAFAVTPVTGWSPGYDLRIGRNLLLGVQTQAGFAQSNPFAASAGWGFNSSSMKFGYDMGRFKPFVSASFAEARAPAFGADLFANAGAPAGVGNPFVPTRKMTTVGAGFDYSITENLSFGVSVSATQAATSGGWSR